MAIYKNKIFQLSNYLPAFFLVLFAATAFIDVMAADIAVEHDKQDARVLFEQAVSLSAQGDWLGAE